MSFPGTYNINYYYGDTYEFRVYPKNSSGEVFSLETFQTAKFTMAPTRGAAVEDQISGYATIDSNNTNIICAIRPNDALNLDYTIQYVYDVEVTKAAEPYDLVYTLLTGNVTITRDITTIESGEPEPIPNNPTALVIGTITDTTISASWTEPLLGGEVTGYKLAIIPFTTDDEEIQTAITNSTTTITSDNTSYVFFGLVENTDYSLIIQSVNNTGSASLATVLTNTEAATTADNPASAEPDFLVRNNGTIEYLIDEVSNDEITLVRGETYVINVDTLGQPFWVQSSPLYSAGDVYLVGIANNGTDSGNIFWTVALDAPDTLYYVSEFSATMNGVISIVDGGS
jgi:hypothetical protein